MNFNFMINFFFVINTKIYGGAWVAQSLKCPTPDFSSSHDQGCDIQPHIGLGVGRGACLRFSLSHSPSAPPSSLKQFYALQKGI